MQSTNKVDFLENRITLMGTMQKPLIFILKILAIATLWRYHPQIVGVTGSVGKTSTKEAIFNILKNKYRVRRNLKNYNNEIGVPLTILGQETGGRSFFCWLKILIFGAAQIIYAKRYPEILILEMGADKIGDIAYLTSFVRCYVGLITSVGEIPVHVEFFQDADHLAREKANLIESLSSNDFAVLNFDDPRVTAMAEKTKATIFSYGVGGRVDLSASQLEEHLENLDDPSFTFKVDYKGSNVPIRLTNILGVHQIYPILAAIAVGLIFKINLVEISQYLKDYQPPAGRLKLLKGIKESWILDDTYNASPNATLAALDVLAKISGRKIAALGDMLELGYFSEEAHRQVGAKAAKCIDLLLAVGERSIFIVDEAQKNGMSLENIHHFSTASEAGKFLQDVIAENDVILVKGSQSMRMEKVVKEIMVEPQKASELLVRQEAVWLKK